MRSLAVVTAGLSNPSSTRQLGEKIAAAVDSAVTSRGESIEVHFIEARDYAEELASALVNTAAKTPLLDDAKKTLSAADGLIVVSPIFQGSYSGLFKMFFDSLDVESINDMPTIIAATAGSARHSMVLDFALRPLMTFLHAMVMPTGVFQATEDFGTPEGARIDQRITRAAGELANFIVANPDHVEGLSKDFSHNSGRKRKSGVGIDTDDFVPMSDLLK
ncbi:FMN reductase [Corynebacterium stationis]|jgi:FMN reductase|uniref:FMN reductase n=1 Tax=Corynebacterium stationis TaxID=1705 RepID=UPI0009508996|nr:FMN reductase [Corynebacterium stationis]APT94933.1 oxidoreductase [Corynebacterium stationis]WLP86753.1 FMN reductase [Corynebacterium stationis]